MDAHQRQLSIKTGVVSRLYKELEAYRVEAETTRGEVAKMEEAQADEYEIRQRRRVLAETERMIPDSEQRLAKALDDLEDAMEAAEDTHAESDEYKKAAEAVKTARPQ